MERSTASWRVAQLDGIQPIDVAGVLYQPLRRLLGVRAFGINGYSARAAGDRLIERHVETGEGSGHHEEAYIVVSGHARFVVGDEEIDAPTGTIVFVPDVAAARSAIALAANTTVIVVGGPADRPLPVSPFEFWFVAEGPNQRGDYRAAIEIVAEGLQQWPDHPGLHYHLACYHSLAGNVEHALDHLARAVAADPRKQEWAESDHDFDSIRDHPRFKTLNA